ncbi:MAG: type III-B CRISPR module-associated protein Cmr5 [Thermosediminibacteraceae bacterium]|nr:type III-B CRISPR module-associated protein Cmr5 [Thermosediminibacteraceae bacterium]
MREMETIRATVNDRARFAYECVKPVSRSEDEEFRSKYKSYSRKLMAMIRVNGLGAVLAFMKAKKEKAYMELYKNIEEWLKCRECPVSSLYNSSEGEDMVKKVISMKSPEYRAVTREVLEFVNWLKRFAEGMIPDDDKQ